MLYWRSFPSILSCLTLSVSLPYRSTLSLQKIDEWQRCGKIFSQVMLIRSVAGANQGGVRTDPRQRPRARAPRLWYNSGMNQPESAPVVHETGRDRSASYPQIVFLWLMATLFLRLVLRGEHCSNIYEAAGLAVLFIFFACGCGIINDHLGGSPGRHIDWKTFVSGMIAMLAAVLFAIAIR